MPTISFDNRFFDNPGSSAYSGLFYGTPTQTWTNATWRYLTFKIMQGTEPSDFSGFTTPTSYDSDLLIKVLPAEQSAPTFTQIVDSEFYDMTFFQNTPVTASQSGTATWFWAYNDGTTNSTGTTPRLICRGTVGALGSGADIELTSGTSIVSGQDYLLESFKIRIPLNISWV